MFLTLTGCMQNLLLTGSSSFIAKYFEQSLNMTTEDSGYTFGESHLQQMQIKTAFSYISFQFCDITNKWHSAL